MRLIDERELIRRISELPDLRTMNTATIGKIIKECRTVDAARWRVERELPNILQIRQDGSLFLYNMDCVERCEVLCEEDDECES